MSIWGVPKIGLPPNHPFSIGFSLQETIQLRWVLHGTLHIFLYFLHLFTSKPRTWYDECPVPESATNVDKVFNVGNTMSWTIPQITISGLYKPSKMEWFIIVLPTLLKYDEIPSSKPHLRINHFSSKSHYMIFNITSIKLIRSRCYPLVI
jgi:hypothetical protein